MSDYEIIKDFIKSLLEREYKTNGFLQTNDIAKKVNEIKDLASKHPELNIINVYNLKFKDKLTIPQVASELNMSEDNVIEALNELVAIVQ